MKISQLKARQLRKRVHELESAENVRRRSWSGDYPGGTNVDTIDVNHTEYCIADTCRKLGHAVVIVPRINGQKYEFLVYALPLPSTI